MKQLLLILAAACLVSHGDGQKRAFALADLYKIRNVEDPQFSPDGKKVTFVVTDDDLGGGKTRTSTGFTFTSAGSRRRTT